MQPRNLSKLFSVFVGILFLTTSAFAQSDAKTDSAAEISNQGSRVSWNINVPYKSVKLTVSTPGGETFSREFPAGETPTFDPSSMRKSSVNGVFKYELVFTPILAPGVEEQLVAARANGTSEKVSQQLIKSGQIPPRMATSGAFSVINGTIFTKNDPAIASETETSTKTKQAPAPPTTKAGDTDIPVDDVQVINDDLVVVGSTCVGQDCSSGESFGFDTLRLKENNLRINFDDTSNSASFPFNDWRIVANDTSNGGASYLAFEDSTAGTIPFRVEAGAPNNSLIVENDGQIGLGTLNPVVELHIVDGDSPTLRLEQDGSSGFTAQTWDIAGNETNFFVRDVTNGSALPFKIKPGANGGSLTVNDGGQVGIGFNSNTTFSTNPLEVRNNSTEQLAVVKSTGELELPKTGGGLRFPDGTYQTTAATGSGFGEINTASNVGTGSGVHKQKVGVDLQFRSIKAGANITVTQNADDITIGSTVSSTGSSTAQHILGGGGHIASFSTITNPTVDFNTFSVGTNGANGFFTTTHQIPYNLNLADQNATQIVVRIRYRDTDGAGAASRVQIELVGVDVTTGGQARNTVFDSNTEAATGFNTVVRCIAAPSALFSASVRGMHANVTVIGTAAQSADFAQMQIYKSTTCP